MNQCFVELVVLLQDNYAMHKKKAYLAATILKEQLTKNTDKAVQEVSGILKTIITTFI